MDILVRLKQAGRVALAVMLTPLALCAIYVLMLAGVETAGAE